MNFQLTTLDGNVPNFLEEYCDDLLEHMSKGFSYETFAAVIETHRSTLYLWEKIFPKWLEAKRVGIEKNMLWWEGIGMALATGKISASPSGWAFNMKNRFKWCDNPEPELPEGNENNVIRLKYNLEE